VAVVSQGDAVFSEKIVSDGRWVNFREKMRKLWKEGIWLVDLEYGMGRWVGVFSDDLRYKSQRYSANSEIDRLEYLIDEGWSDHYKLTEIAFGENRWVLIFAKGTKYRNQRYERADSWSGAYEIIEEQWSRGKDLIEIEYALGKWVMLFAMHTGYLNQRYMSRNRLDAFVKRAKALRKEGYFIVDLANGW